MLFYPRKTDRTDFSDNIVVNDRVGNRVDTTKYLGDAVKRIPQFHQSEGFEIYRSLLSLLIRRLNH